MNANDVRNIAVPYEDVTGWRWPNFSPEEIACRGTGCVPDPEKCLRFADAMDRLQALRDECGHPLIVNSGYRTPEHNRSIPGAAPQSNHMLGIAFDVSIPNVDPVRFEAMAKLGGFNGIGRYPNPGGARFIHIDTRAESKDWGGAWPAHSARFDRHSENPDGTEGVIRRAIRAARTRFLAWLLGGGAAAFFTEYQTNIVQHVGDWIRSIVSAGWSWRDALPVIFIAATALVVWQIVQVIINRPRKERPHETGNESTPTGRDSNHHVERTDDGDDGERKHDRRGRERDREDIGHLLDALRR